MDVRSELSEQEGALLRLIRDAGTISRARLARDSGLSRPSIGARLRSLCDLGLVEEIGRGPSTGGRPPSVVRFADDAGYVIGVDLGATSADVAISDLSARPVAHVAIELDVRDGPEKILGLVCELIDGLMDRLGDDGPTLQSVRGLGIGLPGPVEWASGLPVSPPIMPGWDQFPVGGYLFDRYQRPVFVDNDVNLMALGEGCAGVGIGVANFLYVKLGSGIGCGVICEGKVYRGRNGCAGDIGHIAVNGPGAKSDGFKSGSVTCHCGNTGCLEAVAGGRALGLAAIELAASGTSPGLARTLDAHGTLSAADLAVAISQADLAAVELARAAGAAIGGVLAGLVNFYNPSMVIVGGGVANIGDLLLAAIREAVYRRSSPLATKDLVVTGGALGGRAGVIGATATVLDVLYRLLPMA